ncbi:Uncharacterised protein [Legionella busanensis]|uniref:Uncharacterized protein n=1 Tax=Legionella busanensis TaxID=190655 RepID=A0A378JLG9_9GAMM|nr:hypothetical protein [Legionella busanensis]STX51059.1 Uncharacterised protein [Legionella busanensis]
MRGKYEAMQSLLQEDTSLIFKKAEVTDYSGRTFGFISAFEYALWALDKSLWQLIIKSLPLSQFFFVQNHHKNSIIGQLINMKIGFLLSRS